MLLPSAISIFIILLMSCSNSKVADSIVFNELMPRNRTGMLSPNGKPVDWIEIKNTSNDSINLDGYQLAVISKAKPEDPAKAEKKKNKEVNPDKEDSAESNVTKEINENGEKVITWDFPEFKIGGGECVIIFADKGKSADAPGRTLSAGFKLPKDGATIQLISPRGVVIKEMKYGKLEPDQSLALENDTVYTPTFWQSPGFDNTRDGYDKAMTVMADQRKSPLLISEFMTRAENSEENWVELKNYGNSDIDLSQYQLSKKLGKNEEYWSLPSTTLQPGGIITIKLAGDSKRPGDTHSAPLKAGNSETIILSKDRKFVDGVCGKLTPIGGSIGRMPGKKGFFIFSSPTQNQENGSGGKRFIAESPQFDKRPGVYKNDSTLCLHLKDKTRKVRYTTNGSAPNSSSPLMGDSLVISRGTVIRAYAEGDSLNLRSNIATMTYLPNVKHDLAVMNVTVDKEDLYNNNKGIYANGPGYTPQWPHLGANYFKPWTKDAHVEFFDGKEGFSTDCGLRIFGGFSRAEPKKSFRLKFSGKYGISELNYDVFDQGKTESYKNLVLRSGAQDCRRYMMRDEFFSSLMKQECPTLLIQDYRPIALYVNGEYFGLYYIREKINKHFIARKLNLPTTDSISRLMSFAYAEEGSAKDYNQMLQYVKSHDMSTAENYNHIKQKLDIQGLIDFKLAEMYAGNFDVGNVRYVRSTGKGSDRKWHHVLYDLDVTWQGYEPTPEFYLTTGPRAYNPITGDAVNHNILINRLLTNKEFRAFFLQRTSHHLTNTFSTKNTQAKFDKFVAKIRPEMKLNCERWPELISYNQWDKSLVEFRKKFEDKNKVMLNGLRQYLRITPEEEKKYFAHLGY